ncbi:hypothetical protein MMC18_008439, partial [Xylographa bjoerkii]|nr:hypothetical protein [Xylographa bjoerkii]
MSLTPPSELTFTLPDRTIPRGEKRQSSAVEQLELPLKKRHKTAHESEQAEAGPSTSARITMPDISSPSLVHDLSKGQALISSVSSADQQTLSALSTTELLNFMRVDMSIHIVSGRQGLAYHGTWVRHTNTPVFPATLRRLPFEPSDISTYAYSVIVAATNFIQWQLADIREVTDRIDAGYPFFGPRLSELAALQKLQAKPGVSLYELVSVHYPFPRLVGNVALIVARVEDLIDELNRYQVAMRDEDSGSLDPPATNLLPVEERNCPARVAILMGELTEA